MCKVYFDDKHNKTYLTIFNNKKNQLCLYNINDSTDNLIKVISSPQNIIDYYIETKDSVYFITDNNNLLLLSGGSLTSYSITNSKYCSFDSILLQTNYQFPLEKIDLSFFAYSYPDKALETLNDFQNYFHRNFDCEIQFENDHLVCINSFGKYPDEFQNQFFYDFNPIRTILSDNKIIYSFEALSDLIIYDRAKHSFQNIVPPDYGFHSPEPFEFEKLSDYSYIAKYLTENDRYTNSIYDHFKNRFIRIQSKKTNYENADGTIAKWNTKPFNLLIYDSTFQLQKVVNFPSNKFDNRILYVSQNGLLLITLPDNNDERKFYIYKDI
ncbi:MAG: hypothetical protein DYH00_03370 [Bacteroidetes bacterium CHB6]|nr:hypothetical protein [Bacteroidetes bacterium CHB6]